MIYYTITKSTFIIDYTECYKFEITNTLVWNTLIHGYNDGVN